MSEMKYYLGKILARLPNKTRHQPFSHFLFPALILVLALCGEGLSMCGRKGKRCARKGGLCFRKKDAPSNAESLGKQLCKGKCSCYKIPETTTPETTSKILINSINRSGANSTTFYPVKCNSVSHGHWWMLG